MFAGYADDNHLFSMGKNEDEVKTFLSSDFKITSNWLYEKAHGLKPRKNSFHVHWSNSW